VAAVDQHIKDAFDVAVPPADHARLRSYASLMECEVSRSAYHRTATIEVDDATLLRMGMMRIGSYRNAIARGEQEGSDTTLARMASRKTYDMTTGKNDRPC